MSELVINQIKDLNDALSVAMVRNSGVEHLTNDPSLLSVDQQKHWFYETYIPAYRSGKLSVYLAKSGADAVGYGLIKYDKGTAWLTGVLTPESRGKGYGRTLFEFLIKEAKVGGDKVALDVLLKNKVAFELYQKLGFEVTKKTKTKVVMELK